MASPASGFKGRGAADNPAGRFELFERERDSQANEIGSAPVTLVRTRSAREIVAQGFEVACRRVGLNLSPRGRLDTGKFRVPGSVQMTLP